jgi:threonine synthase
VGVVTKNFWTRSPFKEKESSSVKTRLVAVQSAGCAPIVKAFDRGRREAEFWEGAETVADGLRVPKPLGDFLILDALEKSNGIALSVKDEAILEGT